MMIRPSVVQVYVLGPKGKAHARHHSSSSRSSSFHLLQFATLLELRLLKDKVHRDQCLRVPRVLRDTLRALGVRLCKAVSSPSLS